MELKGIILAVKIGAVSTLFLVGYLSGAFNVPITVSILLYVASMLFFGVLYLREFYLFSTTEERTPPPASDPDQEVYL